MTTAVESNVSDRQLAGDDLLVRRTRRQALIRIARRQPVGTVAAVVVMMFVLIAIFADQIAPYDPIGLNRGHRLEGPSGTFWLGTDESSRDILSRLVVGARISILVGVAATAIGMSAGVIVGLVSGWFSGRIDLVIQRFVDAMIAFPTIILLLALTAVWGPGVLQAILIIGVALAPQVSRVVRGSVLATRPNTYIEAAASLGASNTRIMMRHILPNVAAPIVVMASIVVGGAILAEASLGFLGLGIPPPTPSWGQMLSNSGRAYMESNPLIAIAPGVAITLFVLAFNLFGDALRDVLDPSLRGR